MSQAIRLGRSVEPLALGLAAEIVRGSGAANTSGMELAEAAGAAGATLLAMSADSAGRQVRTALAETPLPARRRPLSLLGPIGSIK